MEEIDAKLGEITLLYSSEKHRVIRPPQYHQCALNTFLSNIILSDKVLSAVGVDAKLGKKIHLFSSISITIVVKHITNPSTKIGGNC